MARKATHAGSWYAGNGDKLNRELTGYLEQASRSEHSFPVHGARAIIAPHAGYSYSGPTAAYAYKCLDVTGIKRIFILGPSHHAYIDGCALTKCSTYQTPLGDLAIDSEVTQALRDTKLFEDMDLQVDEDEHSIEMHLPYTYKLIESSTQEIKIVPILVGSIDEQAEKKFGKILAPYLADEANLFIISSDFCHWGTRFQYTYYKADNEPPVKRLSSTSPLTTPIYQSISNLDHEGMDTIASLSHVAFLAYLRQTRNTICGRHPIGVLLAGMEYLNKNKGRQQKIEFVKYAQSSQCKSIRDSSVSYASGYACM